MIARFLEVQKMQNQGENLVMVSGDTTEIVDGNLEDHFGCKQCWKEISLRLSDLRHKL